MSLSRLEARRAEHRVFHAQGDGGVVVLWCIGVEQRALLVCQTDATFAELLGPACASSRVRCTESRGKCAGLVMRLTQDGLENLDDTLALLRRESEERVVLLLLERLSGCVDIVGQQSILAVWATMSAAGCVKACKTSCLGLTTMLDEEPDVVEGEREDAEPTKDAAYDDLRDARHGKEANEQEEDYQVLERTHGEALGRTRAVLLAVTPMTATTTAVRAIALSFRVDVAVMRAG